MGTVATPADIERQARGIAEQLGGRWTQRGALCPCPAHADRTPSLSVRVGRQAVLVHCFAGCTNDAVMEALHIIGALNGGLLKTDKPINSGAAAREAWVLNKVHELWRGGRKVEGTLAETYLRRHRGLTGPVLDVRFHPRTPLGAAPETRFLPALLVAVRDAAQLVAVQRIFLDPRTGAKAAMEKPKRTLGLLGSGAARLGHAPTRKLGLAEGIEDARSATELTGIPAWATLGNVRFGIVDVPESVTDLVLFVQNDAGGDLATDAGTKAHARPGRTITIERPPRRGDDWNILLRRRAAEQQSKGGGAGA